MSTPKNSEILFNSEHWFKQFKILLNAIYEKQNKDIVLFDFDNLTKIKKEYAKRLIVLRKDMECGYKIKEDNVIDFHKIITLYVMLFLEYPVFKIKANEKAGIYPTKSVVLLNEMFCYNIVQAITKSWTEKTIDENKISCYKEYLLTLFYKYKNCSGINGRKDLVITYQFSSIFYFIEQHYCK